ncbi:Serine/threonine-protein kinase PksC [Bienertia sinuspersici]
MQIKKAKGLKKKTNKRYPTCSIRTSDLRITCLTNYSPPLYQLS